MGYRDIVRDIIQQADIVMEIVDSRFAQKSRNSELEELVEKSGKKLLVVINKSDLVSKRQAILIKNKIEKRCVFVSAKQKKGITRLKIEISKLTAGKESKIAVIGYPNTGKSSIINMLKGRRAARTSSTAGFTKGKQLVRLNSTLMLIDTPGVFPISERDETLMALLGAKNAEHLKDLEGTGIEVAQYLLEEESLKEQYGISAGDGEEFLEQLAVKKNRLLRGGKPDLNAAARMLIDDFQKGKITSKQAYEKNTENGVI